VIGDLGNTYMQTPSAIILAGGRSSRMGSDKALLSLPGAQQVTFVEHLVSLITTHCPEVVLVARDAAQASQFASLTTLAGRVQIITDLIPGGGPLMGLYSGLRAIHASRALLAAVDMPFVSSAMLALLLAQATDEAVLLPVVDNAPQVLLAVYPSVLLPIIEERLQAGQRGPRSLLEKVPVRYLPEAQLRAVDPQLRSFINVNTPEEFAAQRPSG
jgi:molybdopterin-guanine dinucleotide biosynthesis protein A